MGRAMQARAAAEQNRREIPWAAPKLSGPRRVRLVLERHEAAIRGAYEAGGTCQGLAREYGVPESTMRNFFRRAQIQMRPLGKVTPQEVEQMVSLRERGWTYEAIGKKFGVTRVAVKRRLGQSTPPAAE